MGCCSCGLCSPALYSRLTASKKSRRKLGAPSTLSNYNLNMLRNSRSSTRDYCVSELHSCATIPCLEIQKSGKGAQHPIFPKILQKQKLGDCGGRVGAQICPLVVLAQGLSEIYVSLGRDRCTGRALKLEAHPEAGECGRPFIGFLIGEMVVRKMCFSHCLPCCLLEKLCPHPYLAA